MTNLTPPKLGASVFELAFKFEELTRQRCNKRVLSVQVNKSVGTGKKKPEDMLCHVKLDSQKDLASIWVFGAGQREVSEGTYRFQPMW